VLAMENVIEINQSLRVCSYNIHKGRSVMSFRNLLDEIRHVIQLLNADLMFLQEVSGETGVSSSLQISQFEFLADSVWPHYAYGKNAVYEGGDHGNAILSKTPFSSVSNNLDVSVWKFSRRGILQGVLANDIYLFCLHFGLFAAERKRQLESLVRLLESAVPENAAVIVAGDFNDWNLSADSLLKAVGLKEVYSEINGKLARTFPAPFPCLAMDRIYFRNLVLADAEVLSGKPWSRLSDHCALYATFER